MKTDFFYRFPEKNSDIRINENPSSGAEFLHAGGPIQRCTDGDTKRNTDMTKLIAAFRSYANAPKLVGIQFLI